MASAQTPAYFPGATAPQSDAQPDAQAAQPFAPPQVALEQEDPIFQQNPPLPPSPQAPPLGPRSSTDATAADEGSPDAPSLHTRAVYHATRKSLTGAGSQQRFGRYNFGGRPVPGSGQSLSLGMAINRSLFAMIASAGASEPLTVESCLADKATDARSAEPTSLPVSAQLPGFYGAPWVSVLNKTLVTVLYAEIPAATSRPVPMPTIEIYRHYSTSRAAPDYTRRVPAKVYRGSKDVLYRLFVDGPIKCIDLEVPNGAREGHGTIYYFRSDRLYQAVGTFILQN